MMTDKDRYVQQEIQKIYSFWISFSMIGGALSFLLLSGLDYLVTPENLFKFLYYRITEVHFQSSSFLRCLLHSKEWGKKGYCDDRSVAKIT